MEQLIVGVIEKSLVGGAFIYMLHYFFTQFSRSLEKATVSLEKVTAILDDISNMIIIMDARMQGFEQRVEKLEERG